MSTSNLQEIGIMQIDFIPDERSFFPWVLAVLIVLLSIRLLWRAIHAQSRLNRLSLVLTALAGVGMMIVATASGIEHTAIAGTLERNSMVRVLMIATCLMLFGVVFDVLDIGSRWIGRNRSRPGT